MYCMRGFVRVTPCKIRSVDVGSFVLLHNWRLVQSMRFEKKQFAVIFNTMNSLEVVSQTLPSIMREVSTSDAILIVHDTSIGDDSSSIRSGISELVDPSRSIFISSDNVPASAARNMCLQLANELAMPEYIGFVEDDHGFREGFLKELGRAVAEHYGRVMPNGLRAGIFSGCSACNGGERIVLNEAKDFVRGGSEPTTMIGGVNACCRFAPASHWARALRYYDIDEYYISEYQTSGVNIRNYNLGFCSVVVGGGQFMFDKFKVGRGTSATGLKLWDRDFTASDPRARFQGKDDSGLQKSGKFGEELRLRSKHIIKRWVR